MFANRRLSMTNAIVTAMQAVLLPNEDNLSSVQQTLPQADDGNSMSNQVRDVQGMKPKWF